MSARITVLTTFRAFHPFRFLGSFHHNRSIQLPVSGLSLMQEESGSERVAPWLPDSCTRFRFFMSFAFFSSFPVDLLFILVDYLCPSQSQCFLKMPEGQFRCTWRLGRRRFKDRRWGRRRRLSTACERRWFRCPLCPLKFFNKVSWKKKCKLRKAVHT
jgi:hypothetical protein